MSTEFEVVFRKLDELKEVCDGTNLKVTTMNGTLNETKKLAEKHEKILYGNPEEANTSGLINKVSGIGSSLDNFKAKYTMWLLGVVGAVQIVFTALVNRFFHK